MIYHITSKTAWQRAIAENSYSGDTLFSEGFIHCSKASQVNGSLNKHFKGKANLLLLCINEDLLVSKLVFENLMGGDNLYPHIYGTLNTNAVEKIIELELNSENNFFIETL